MRTTRGWNAKKGWNLFERNHEKKNIRKTAPTCGIISQLLPVHSVLFCSISWHSMAALNQSNRWMNSSSTRIFFILALIESGINFGIYSSGKNMYICNSIAWSVKKNLNTPSSKRQTTFFLLKSIKHTEWVLTRLANDNGILWSLIDTKFNHLSIVD